MISVQEFSDHDALFDATAELLAAQLSDVAAARGRASLAVAGGRTPAPVYERLSRHADVPWAKVSVTLTDERVAPAGSDLLNARLLRETLLRGPAASATYVPLREGPLPDDLAFPLDAIVLGMGKDGHYASIFPNGDGIAAAETGDQPAIVATTPSPLPPEAPVSRLTLNRAAISEARLIILLITGPEKQALLAGDDIDHLPIGRLAASLGDKLNILWAS